MTAAEALHRPLISAGIERSSFLCVLVEDAQPHRADPLTRGKNNGWLFPLSLGPRSHADPLL